MIIPETVNEREFLRRTHEKELSILIYPIKFANGVYVVGKYRGEAYCTTVIDEQILFKLNKIQENQTKKLEASQ